MTYTQIALENTLVQWWERQQQQWLANQKQQQSSQTTVIEVATHQHSYQPKHLIQQSIYSVEMSNGIVQCEQTNIREKERGREHTRKWNFYITSCQYIANLLMLLQNVRIAERKKHDMHTRRERKTNKWKHFEFYLYSCWNIRNAHDCWKIWRNQWTTNNLTSCVVTHT